MREREKERNNETWREREREKEKNNETWRERNIRCDSQYPPCLTFGI